MTILITGASGFIGEKLTKVLAKERSVVCLSRKKPEANAPYIEGSFHSFEDLRQLDSFHIDTVIHLAAATGGCSEEEGLAVNVQGTRRLYRYLLDKGCRKFITASSIAAAGCLDPGFIPISLPIPDDHPCLAKDAYGTSKALVEGVIEYFHRLYPDASFINYRLGVVTDDEQWSPQPITQDSSLSVPFTLLSRVFVSDAIRAIMTAVHTPLQHGVSTYNVVGPDASCDDPVAAILESCMDSSFHHLLEYYRMPERSSAPIFDMRKIKQELGFEPLRSVRPRVQMRYKGSSH